VKILQSLKRPADKVITYEAEMPIFQFDPLTGFGGAPNLERDVAFEGASGPLVRVRLNDQGDRDEPFEVKPGVKNIVCYGGSHTWGAYVDQDKRYTDLLDRRLSGFRCVNLGMGSFGLDQICLSILERSRRYSPSVVAIEQYPWAVHRVLNSYVQGYVKPSFYIDASGALKLRKVPALARYKSYRRIDGAYRLYKKELAEFKGGIDIKTQYDPFADPIFLLWKTAFYEQMYLLIEKILCVIKDHCTQNRYRLIFLIIAYSQQFGHDSGSGLIDYELPAKRFKAILDKLRIEYVDTAPSLVRSHSIADPVIMPDGHTNPRGHAVIADLLEEGMRSRGWLGEVKNG
jgi:hypothetical protein